MLIREIINSEGPTFSFEFFPPKSEEGVKRLYETIAELAVLKPSFVSVTYGAGGSTREMTVDLTARIQAELNLTAMAHLTCVGHTVEEIRLVLDRLVSHGIRNVLALRGDPPKGQTHFLRPESGFGYGYELVQFIRQHYSFSIGAACYPEGHVECPDKRQDLERLCVKVDAGADFLITQLFFDADHYFSFVQRARAIGIRVPIIPGIMPVTNANQLERFTSMCGAEIPQELRRKLEVVGEDEKAVIEVGVEWASEQCRRLLGGGAPGIHFYTLNKSTSTLRVFQNLHPLLAGTRVSP